MLDPLTALGVAGNVLQIIDFGFQLVGEGNKIYHATNGALEENKAAEDLANDLSNLTSGLSASQDKWMKAHGDTQLDPDEVRLRNICDRCTEIAVELRIHLQKLKVQEGVKYRKLKSYKQALISVWRKDQVEAVAGRLEKYQREIDTHILFGLRKSADQADLKNSAQFTTLDQRTKDLTVAVLEGGKKLDGRLSDHSDVLAKIHEQNNQILSTIVTERKRSPSPVPPYEAVVASEDVRPTPLHVAAEAGDAVEVRKLLRSPTVDIHARDRRGCTPLHVASTGEVAKRLLADRRIDKNIDDFEGRSALHCAVLKRSLDVIKELLAAGIDSSIKDDREKTADFYACECPTAWWMLRYGHETEVRAKDHLQNTGLIQMAWLGDAEGTEFFFKHGADVNARNEWKETALTESARHGDSHVVEILINHRANIEIAGDAEEWTPLLQAVRDNREEVMRILLRHGANKEAKLKNGNTPLVEACARSHFRLAEILVEAGSRIEVSNNHQWTPLLFAAHENQLSLTRSLLSRGANKEHKEHNGCTAVHNAVWRGPSETLELLLEHGANPNPMAFNGFTALTRAANLGRYDVVKALLQYGADVNMQATNGSGYTALAETAHHGHTEVAKLLLVNGARWDIGSKSGFGALSIAANNGQDSIIRILVEHGADIEQVGFSNKDPGLSITPLMRAAMEGFASTVGLLAELGANLDAQDALGRTALLLAAMNKRVGCVEMLIQEGANVNIRTNKQETALMKAAFNGSEDIARLLVEANANLRLRDWRGTTAWIMAKQTAHDRELEHLLKPEQDENETLHRMQAERDPSEIAAYLNEIYH